MDCRPRIPGKAPCALSGDSGGDRVNRVTLSKLVNQHGANIQTGFVDKLCSYFACRIEELVEHVAEAAKGAADVAPLDAVSSSLMSGN